MDYYYNLEIILNSLLDDGEKFLWRSDPLRFKKEAKDFLMWVRKSKLAGFGDADNLDYRLGNSYFHIKITKCEDGFVMAGINNIEGDDGYCYENFLFDVFVKDEGEDDEIMASLLDAFRAKIIKREEWR